MLELEFSVLSGIVGCALALCAGTAPPGPPVQPRGLAIVGVAIQLGLIAQTLLFVADVLGEILGWQWFRASRHLLLSSALGLLGMTAVLMLRWGLRWSPRYALLRGLLSSLAFAASGLYPHLIGLSLVAHP